MAMIIIIEIRSIYEKKLGVPLHGSQVDGVILQNYL